jgi:hypothetical protein
MVTEVDRILATKKTVARKPTRPGPTRPDPSGADPVARARPAVDPVRGSVLHQILEQLQLLPRIQALQQALGHQRLARGRP